MESTKITKDVKILMLNILKNGTITKEQKQELVNKLDLSLYAIEIIDSRSQVKT